MKNQHFFISWTCDKSKNRLLPLLLKQNSNENSEFVFLEKTWGEQLIWWNKRKIFFLTFPAYYAPIIFSLDLNCSDLLYLRNIQEQLKKAFCYHKLFWPFTVRTNSWPSASNFKTKNLDHKNNFFSQCTVQNNFGNKIQFFTILSVPFAYSDS